MSDTEAKNDKEPNDKGAGPTRSFDGSTPGPGGQIGPFRIERELGRGAVGVVYLAHDTKLDRPVAIKSLPAEVMANPKAPVAFFARSPAVGLGESSQYRHDSRSARRGRGHRLSTPGQRQRLGRTDKAEINLSHQRLDSLLAFLDGNWVCLGLNWVCFPGLRKRRFFCNPLLILNLRSFGHPANWV